MTITPFPIPQSARSVLLFGGMFDPPHWAHVHLAIAARDAVLGREGWIVYVPAARSPHKPGGPRVTDAARLAMLGLALADRTRVGIWTDELDRKDDPSYWVDTVRRARSSCDAETDLRFLIGADQALAFHQWREHETIRSLAEPVVMLRSPAPTTEALRDGLHATGAWTESEIDAWIRSVVPQEVLEMSSTDVRTKLRRGEPVDVVDERVRAYIERLGLYQ